ncbi:MAG: pyridoxamine 5'-phosphate oxidase family protein [Candidatus Dormibacteraeota bacterium]|nr:pyridoxamine 5'-phosphate oxidase family protein [Candidatus Dormibacteraeota bacterium]
MAVIDETTPFGKRAAERLRTESVVWLTTIGSDGTPQPNPVWFLWDGADGVIVYNDVAANRMRHITERPRVSLNFNSAPGGDDIVVLRGRASEAPDLPACSGNAEYQAKYGASIKAGPFGGPEGFDRQFSNKLRIRIEGVRGW